MEGLKPLWPLHVPQAWYILLYCYYIENISIGHMGCDPKKEGDIEIGGQVLCVLSRVYRLYEKGHATPVFAIQTVYCYYK